MVDSLGFIYISNSAAHVIHKISPNGTQVATLSASTLYYPFYPTQLALDSAGALYAADFYSSRAVKFNGTGVQQVFAIPYGNYAVGVAVDSQGAVYLSDSTRNVVAVFAANGTFVFNLITSSPPFRGPRGLWVDANLNVLVADPSNNRIVKFYSQQSGYTGGYGPGVSHIEPGLVNGYTAVSLYPGLDNPTDVALDGLDNMYVVSGNNRVVKLQAGTSGTVLQTYAITTGLALSSPQGICLDSSSSVYVVDSGNSRVVKFDSSGSVTHIYTASSTSPTMAYAFGCVVNSLGYLFILHNSTYDAGISKMTPDGSQVAYLGGGTLLPTQYSKLTLDSCNQLYVVDGAVPANARVLKLDATTGAQLQVYTLPTYPGQSTGVAVDQNGVVYVTGLQLRYYLQSCIYLFAPDGTLLSTLVMGSNAQPMYLVSGLAVDAIGSVYAADMGNNRVVVFQAPGSSTSGGRR